MLNKKKEVTNWAKAGEQKNTNWHQNVSQNPQNPYFCSVRMVPQEVVLFLTLEVVLLLTLERLKRGKSKLGPSFLLFLPFLFFKNILLSVGRMRFFKKI